MKHIPKLPDDSVNISKGSPLKEFFILTSAISALVCIVYIILGLSVDTVVDNISPENERWLRDKVNLDVLNYNHIEPTKEDLSLFKKAEKVFAKIHEKLPDDLQYIHIGFHPVNEVNAFALPSGKIVVTKGLLHSLNSENELAFIIGHEIGHIANKDHLKRLGRGLVTTIISGALFGQKSYITDFISSSTASIDSSFSREQEQVSDIWGLRALIEIYSHVGGATDFFKKLEHTHGSENIILSYFSSHPRTINRVIELEDIIQRENFPVRETLPF